MSIPKSIFVVLLFGILGAVLFFSNYSNYAPQSSLDLKFTRTEIIALAREYLSKMGYHTDGLTADANFRFDSGTTLYLEEELGLAEAHRVLRDTLATHNWDVYFFNRSLPPNQMPDQFNVWVSPAGRIIGFKHTLPDSVGRRSLAEEQARALAEDFLQREGVDISRYALEKSTANQLPNRKDYTFNWARKDSVYSMAAKIWVKVNGDKIGGFRYELEEPEAFGKEGSKVQTFVIYVIAGASTATFILLIFIITLFLKKYHEGEVGVKTAIGVFVLLFSLILFEHLLAFTTIGYGSSMGNVNRFNTRIIVFVIAVFIVQALMAAMVFAGWSVGESSARQGWANKLKAIDGLYNWKPFTLEFANSVVRGYSFGFIILGAISGIIAIAAMRSKFGIFIQSLLGIPESIFPSLSAVFLALRIAIINEIVFRFFFISWLREKKKKIWPGIVISSLLWTLIAFNLWDFPFGYLDFIWLFPSYFLISVILGWILVKYDLLTAIFTNFVVLAFSYAIPMLASSAPFFDWQSKLFYGFMALPLLAAAIGYVKRQQFQFSLEVTPAHIRRISERERMAKELEIARNVQMSLLPKENPLLEGFDIAGVCIPALEVGGDYYDFFQLGDSKIGIAIGDVSGKGVPAAIYMTLTKGILQSHASENISPKEVLNKLNRQIYLNIEKNSFVSMFYAVLDMKKHTIRFARAGHNPAILAHRGEGGNTFLQPKGIALGLEAGKKFYEFLEEHEIRLQSGDVLTFYTDGFTEASTKEGEEYSEERLEQVISQNKDVSANVIIQNVVRAVKKFVGSHPQHDDMTMVVVKVL